MGLNLFLIRHEDAEPGQHLPDALRSLTAVGRRRMRTTGSFFAAMESVDVIFTSPLVRAVQTTEILAAALGLDAPIHARAVVAEPATVEAFLSVLDELSGERRIAIVGHEPTMSYVSTHLLGHRFPRSFSKGMILALDYDPTAMNAKFRFLIDGDGPTLVSTL
jgi:phosphohistidine phosphatase